MLAIVVALGGISGVCGRLLGLVTLCLQLRRLGIPKFEVCMICLAMISVIGMNLYFIKLEIISDVLTFTALAFAEYIIDTGVTVFVINIFLKLYVIQTCPQIDATDRCLSVLQCSVRPMQLFFMGILVNLPRSHLPISSARSVVHTLLDVYVLSRLMSLIAPGFLSIRHRIRAFVDIRTIRVISLLISELLLITPSVRSVGVVSDSALFTVGSLLVLGKLVSHHLSTVHTNQNQRRFSGIHQVSVGWKA